MDSLDQKLLTVNNDIGQQELNKLKTTPLPSSLDLGLTRVYFTNLGDGFSRIFMLVVQLLWIGLVFFNGIGFGQIVANLPQIPPLLAFQKVVLQVIAMFITIFFAFLILIMLLPVFLAKTIKGINLTCLVFLIVGTIINLIIIGISVFMFYYSSSPYRIAVLILSSTTILLWWFTILYWWLNTIESKRHLIKSIIKMYQLSFK